MQSDKRRQQLENWLQLKFSDNALHCEPASSDASFRRYFRITHNSHSYVVMDAPPDRENCEPFVRVTKTLRDNEIQSPEIFHASLDDGFLVLSDFGSVCYLDRLSSESVDGLYDDAIGVVHKMHQIDLNDGVLPIYDEELLLQEMGLLQEWFFGKLLGLSLDPDDVKALAVLQHQLASSALEQPQVFVHRDFHSRNLMVTDDENPGVIDFQDAVYGPLTYDLVSLLRDCYIAWPDKQIYAWLDGFLAQRKARGVIDDFDSVQFYSWFDLMGVQRHMKAIGIFSRLLIRDGKLNYIQDIPRTLGYILQLCNRYEMLAPLSNIIVKHKVLEKLDRVIDKKVVS
jgi:hypothetical protein